MRVRVSKIAALADDLALALSAKRIRIQAPVPSKGYVGIEVPNDAIALVALEGVEAYLPLAGLVDLEQELARLRKALADAGWDVEDRADGFALRPR